MKPQERKRYSRQIILPEMGLEGQEKLAGARVLVIGAGGLGCPVLQYLVAAGVGTIGVVDDDTVDITNLHRQILYTAEDVGRGKAFTATRKLSVMNPAVELLAIPVRLTERNAAEIISGYDLVVDGSDNFSTRYLANDICTDQNKPLVFGSILRFEGQVSVFNYNGGPTYRCLFPEADEGENCETAGVIGVLPGIIGSYMASEVIKVICGIGTPLSGKLLVVSLLTNKTDIFSFSRTTYTEPRPTMTNREQEQTAPADPAELLFADYELLAQSGPDNILLVDVREDYEFEEDYIGGINIPLPDLHERITEIPNDRIIVFYCRSGVRSLRAVKLLKKNGFTGQTYWMQEE